MDSSMMNWLPVVGVFIAFAGLTLAMRRSNRADYDRLDKKLDAFCAEIKAEIASQSAQLNQRLDEKLGAQSLQVKAGIASQSAQRLEMDSAQFRRRLEMDSAQFHRRLEMDSARFRQRLEMDSAQFRRRVAQPLLHKSL